MFDKEFKDKIREKKLSYEHRLIDDMVAAALKWSGGYVWACKNYDGDVQSDTVAQGYGSLGLMTSVADHARRQHRRGRGCPWHRDPALIASTRRAARPRPIPSPRFSPGRAGSRTAPSSTTIPTSRNSPATLEKVTIGTVEAGYMTKDLAVLVGPEQKWLTTTGFLDKVDENLRKAMA